MTQEKAKLLSDVLKAYSERKEVCFRRIGTKTLIKIKYPDAISHELLNPDNEFILL